MNDSVSITTTAYYLLVELNNLPPSEANLNDELLSALHGVFHPCLCAALDIVEKQQVTLYQSPCGRSIYQVKGTTGMAYNVLSTSLYCTCPSFTFTVLKKRSSFICKHILATYIAKATSRLQHVMLTDEEIALRFILENDNA